MARRLSDSIQSIRGLGDKSMAQMELLGIHTFHDLLWHIPFRFEDYSATPSICDVQHGDTVTLTGRIAAISTRALKGRKLKITEAILEDDTGKIKLVWFNQAYVERQYPLGTLLAVAGKVDTKFGRQITNPFCESPGRGVVTGRLLPVYRLSAGLTQRKMRSYIAEALSLVPAMIDWIPTTVLTQEALPVLSEAIQELHAPTSLQAFTCATERLKFDELLAHQLMFRAVRRRRRKSLSRAFEVSIQTVQELVKTLPFTLTNGQKQAIWEAIQDVAKQEPMNRLVQGDVGSGKTAIAGVLMAYIAKKGGRCTYLAPTELLAHQQGEAVMRLFPRYRVGVLTGSKATINGTMVTRGVFLEAVTSGEIDFLIGTHAILEATWASYAPALVVIDEQHRFGVKQRHRLLSRGGEVPHLLSLTATPIPRSLALTVYGDLDISVVRDKPPGRLPVSSELVLGNQKALWQHVQKEITLGHGVYVVVPSIEPEEDSEGCSVEEMLPKIKTYLPGVRMGVAHGRLPSTQKQEALEAFRKKTTQLLLATTVIEVGVDVPHASVMVILGAERFGLSQLHQLRGRVGRGSIASTCFVVPQQSSEHALERLRAFVATEDGFALAKKDLAFRGAGNIFGDAQSGMPDFRFASWGDGAIMEQAKRAVEHLEQTEGITKELDAHIEALLDTAHLE